VGFTSVTGLNQRDRLLDLLDLLERASPKGSLDAVEERGDKQRQ
jgi:hypothetical protein